MNAASARAPAWRARLHGLPTVALCPGLVVHAAATRWARLRGLARLPTLPADRGLLLPRTRSVHTVGMRFALDLLWLDGEGAVARVDRDVAPRRHRACRRARSVLEVRAGAADRFLAAFGATVLLLTTSHSLRRARAIS